MDLSNCGNCLFCLNKILPYSIITSGDNGDGSAALLIPSFEVVCNYLKLKFPVQFFRRPSREGEEVEGLSIFRATCDKFLCLDCFQRVNSLRILYEELRDIQGKIEGVTRGIKDVIIEHNELQTEAVIGGEAVSVVTAISTEGGSEQGVRNFAKKFENHVRLVTQASTVFKGENTISDAFMEIKQEQEQEQELQQEEETEDVGVFDVSNEQIAQTAADTNTDLTISVSDAEEDVNSIEKGFKNTEMTAAAQAAKTLQELAGTICSRNKEPQTEVKRRQVFECHHCNKCYATIRNLEAHIASQHASTKLKKSRTALFPRDKFSLRAKTEVEIDGRKMYQCPQCKKNYDKIKALRNHISRNHPPGSKPVTTPVVTCKLCKTYKTFKNEQLLQKHMFSMHTHGSKYKCNQCDKRFHARQSLNFHVDAEHKGVRYKCSMCPKYFTHPAHLKQHAKLVHHKQGLLKCPHCEREFARQCDLNSHIIVHDPNAQKNHVCDICGKEFLLRAGLADHVKVHKERRFQCTYCTDKFKKHSHLVAHVRKHTGERPFQCSVCDRSFAVKSTLTMHMKTHVGPPKKRGKKPKKKISEAVEENTTGGENIEPPVTPSNPAVPVILSTTSTELTDLVEKSLGVRVETTKE